MSWETVKGFFRRQTQHINEEYRHYDKTSDPQLEQSVNVVLQYQGKMRRVEGHLESLQNALGQSLLLLNALHTEFAEMGLTAGETLTDAARMLDLFANDTRKKFETLQAGFNKERESRKQFDVDCNRMLDLLTKRKAVMLEYDFFRNKVANLRANPPGDVSRIPRNEGRVIEWEKKFEDMNAQCKSLTHQLKQTGSRLALETCRSVIGETGRYYDEAGRVARAALMGQGLSLLASNAMQQASTAMQQAQSVAQRAVGQVAQLPPPPYSPQPQQAAPPTYGSQEGGAAVQPQPAAGYTAPQSNSGQPTTPPQPAWRPGKSPAAGSTTTSQRSLRDDDPFRL